MLSSSVSARSCSTRSAASASSRWRTNCTSSPNTTAPPTVMLRAIISGGNHAGRGGPRPATSPTAPETTNTTTKAMNQRTPACAPVKIRAPSGARMPHSPTAPDATNPPTNAIETVGREQDVPQLDAEQPVNVAGAREDADRHQRDQRVQPRHEPRPDAQGEVDGAPQDRDRQDQQADEDQQRLAQPDLVAVIRIGADRGDTTDPPLVQPASTHPWAESVAATRPWDGVRARLAPPRRTWRRPAGAGLLDVTWASRRMVSGPPAGSSSRSRTSRCSRRAPGPAHPRSDSGGRPRCVPR